MTQVETDFMEVKPASQGCYNVTVYFYKQDKYDSDPLYFDGGEWGCISAGISECYVCFIGEK